MRPACGTAWRTFAAECQGLGQIPSDAIPVSRFLGCYRPCECLDSVLARFCPLRSSRLPRAGTVSPLSSERSRDLSYFLRSFAARNLRASVSETRRSFSHHEASLGTRWRNCDRNSFRARLAGEARKDYGVWRLCGLVATGLLTAASGWERRLTKSGSWAPFPPTSFGSYLAFGSRFPVPIAVRRIPFVRSVRGEIPERFRRGTSCRRGRGAVGLLKSIGVRIGN